MGPGTLQELLPSLDLMGGGGVSQFWLSHNRWVTVSTTTSTNSKRQNNEKEGKHERSSPYRVLPLFFYSDLLVQTVCVCVYTFELAVLSVFVPLFFTKGDMHLFSMLIWPPFLVDLLRHAINSWSQVVDRHFKHQEDGSSHILSILNITNMLLIVQIRCVPRRLLLLWRAWLDVKCTHALFRLTLIKAYTRQRKSISGPVTWVSESDMKDLN